MNSNVRIKDLWREQRIYTNRTVAALFVIAILSFALIGQLVWLQIFQHDYYLELSQGNRVRLDPIPASRGLMLDRNGKILADNEPGYQLELVREQTPDLKDTLNRLVKIGIIAPDDLDETRRIIMARRTFDSVPIRLRMTDEELGRFAVHRHEFPGVDLVTRPTRHYPYGELAVHALGYVGAISETDLKSIDRSAYNGTTLIGKTGVEARFEKELHGKNGYRQILVNAQGRSVTRVGAYVPELQSALPDAGEDLLLSIDLDAQKAAEDALGENRGAVVALDPNNGDILALVSHPGFDPSLFARGLTRAEYAALTDNIQKPMLNRALRGAYPSGSTIKPVMALAGLTYKILNPDEREFCAGQFHLPGSSHMYREGRTGRHGYVNLKDAIAKSCDIYFYELASRLGVDRIDTFLAPFGFGALTGIDIDGEKPGLLPSPAWKKKAYKRPQDQVWFPGETVNFGVGQGYLLITPLQLAHMVSVIAERGKSFRPRIVTGVRDLQGKVTTIEPLANPSVTGVSDNDWNIVIDGMMGATTYGTAAAIGKNAAYPIAAKTGTAQVFTVAQGAKYNEKEAIAKGLRDHALFIAFAPADKPRIALAVLVENAGFGASAAGPIARKVMDAYLLGIGSGTSIVPDPTLTAPAASAAAGGAPSRSNAEAVEALSKGVDQGVEESAPERADDDVPEPPVSPVPPGAPSR